MERLRRKQRRRTREAATSAERTGSLPPAQNRRVSLQLLLATMAGQERRRDAPCSIRTALPHATTAGQESCTFTAIQRKRRTCGHQIIEEDGAAPCNFSPQPLEQRKNKKHP
jgi:hypothetical protein